MLRLIAAACLLLLASAMVPASGATVAGVYDGYVQRYNAGQPAPAGFPDFHGSYNPQLADPVEIDFSYDTDTAPDFTFSGPGGIELARYPISSLSITIGSFQATMPNPALGVSAAANFLFFLGGGIANTNVPGISILGFGLIIDPDFHLGSVALPTSVIDPRIGHGAFGMSLTNGSSSYPTLFGAVPTYAPVPIPQSLILFVTALGGLIITAVGKRSR